MDNLPPYLQYGEEISVPHGSLVYEFGQPVDEKPFFYLVAGLVKIEFPLGGNRLPLWITPDTIFGPVEPLSGCTRLCSAHAMEKTILYRWDMDGFFTAVGVSWELALVATTGLTRELRILNAEFEERIRLSEGSAS